MTNLFPSYKHSGQCGKQLSVGYYHLYTIGKNDGCCNDCFPRECRSNFVASYDLDGNILVPSGNPVHDPELIGNWANTKPVGQVHPIPCSYQVSIQGINNLSINESWCQNCTDLNSTYYITVPFESVVSPYYTDHIGSDANTFPLTNNNRCVEWFSGLDVWAHIQRLGTIQLCSIQNPISKCGFTNLTIYLMIGQRGEFEEWWKPYNREQIAPYYTTNKQYVYRNKNKTKEGRSQLYLFAVAHFEIPRWGTSPNNTLNTTYNVDGYVFQTELGEFNGDYTFNLDSGGTIVTDPNESYKGIIPFSDTTEGSLLTYWGGLGGSYSDSPTKVYHGDFDGRNLSFTIRGSDRLTHLAYPDFENFNMICYMDSMSISVSPIEDSQFETGDGSLSFRGWLSPLFGNSYLVSDVITESFAGWAWPSYGFACNGWSGNVDQIYEGNDWTSMFWQYGCPHGFMGPVPEVAYITLEGFSSLGDEDDKYACTDAERLNGIHALRVTCHPKNLVYYPYQDWSSIAYHKDFNEAICCQCNNVKKDMPCISTLKVSIQQIWNGGSYNQVGDGNGQTTITLHLLKTEIETITAFDPTAEIIATYQAVLQWPEWQPPDTNPWGLTLADVDGITLSLIYTNPDYENDISCASSVTFNISAPNSCPCLLSRECVHCATDTQTAEVLVESSEEPTCFTLFNPDRHNCNYDYCATAIELGFADDTILSLSGGSYNSFYFFSTSDANCVWKYNVRLDTWDWGYLDGFKTLNLIPIVGHQILRYDYGLGDFTVEYEDVMLVEFVVELFAYLDSPFGAGSRSYYHGTLPLSPKLDGRGYWIDCNFDMDLDYVGSNAGIYNAICCLKLGNTIHITAQ